jgi:hypothetical protein
MADQFDHGTDIEAARAQQAVEPVFSISDPYSFHNVYDVYRNGFADPAFVNATVSVLMFAEHDYKLSSGVLFHQGQAMRYISQQLGDFTSIDCTIGAILLLVGIEVSRSRCITLQLQHLTVHSGVSASAM